jgi:hypothetical protein
MEGKEVDGRSFYGRGERDFGSSGICREKWSFGVGLYQSGTRVAGGFGHGGQDIHMISWS